MTRFRSPFRASQFEPGARENIAACVVLAVILAIVFFLDIRELFA